MTKIDASLEEKKRRMEELVKLLNEAERAYYQEAREIMSNYEYDRLYDELVALEDKLHTTLAASPTVHVGYEVVSELPKERHERPMLSLDKTKEVERLKEFLGDQEALISWKMDGLTIVLTYRDGALYKAVTRGNGEIGEVVTNNAKVFRNIPLKISYQGELILRGDHIRASWSFAERRLFLMKILRRSMKRLRMWTPNTRIRGIFAVGRCVSSIMKSRPGEMSISMHSPLFGPKVWILKIPEHGRWSG